MPIWTERERKRQQQVAYLLAFISRSADKARNGLKLGIASIETDLEFINKNVEALNKIVKEDQEDFGGE